MPRRMAYDRWLFFTTLAVTIAGLIMVGSSSSYVAMSGGNPAAFYFKQSLHAALGFAVFFFALRMRYQNLADRKLIVAAFVGFLGLLAATLAMDDAGGASRWIGVGPVRVQPSEFAKLFVVLFMAYMLSRKEERIREPLVVLFPCGMVVGALAFLIAIEDLGSATILAAIAGLMLFVAGLPWRWVGAATGALAAAFALGVAAAPYRVQRLMTFLDPGADPLGAGFQLLQSLIAFGNGGILGVGLGQGQQKAYYVSESHTDFIFATIGEELGFVGTIAFLLVFLIVFWRGLRAAVRAPDRFGFYLAFGLTCLLVLQALINMAVCVGLVPTKGLALPFVSYGGSSLLASLGAMGLLLNVSQHSN